MARELRGHSVKNLMNRILPLGQTCNRYLRRYGKSQPNIEMCCPLCGRTMHKHGCYYRTAAMRGRAIKIPIYRWYCPSCKKTLSLLPDFLIPWARYTTVMREIAVRRKMEGKSFAQIADLISSKAVAVSRCTVKRWYKRHLRQVEKVSLWLCKKLIQAGTEQDLLRQYTPGVNPTPQDTIYWFQKLLALYAPAHSFLRGYWQWLNKKLPIDNLL